MRIALVWLPMIHDDPSMKPDSSGTSTRSRNISRHFAAGLFLFDFSWSLRANPSRMVCRTLSF
jgi:hypothetical protein